MLGGGGGSDGDDETKKLGSRRAGMAHHPRDDGSRGFVGLAEIGAGGRRPATYDIRDRRGQPRGVEVERGGADTTGGAAILGFDRATKVDAEGSMVRFERG